MKQLLAALAASAALAAPVAAQAYPMTPAQLQYEQWKDDNWNRHVNRQQQQWRGYDGAFEEFEERRSCFANNLPHCY